MSNEYLSRLPGFYRYSVKNRQEVLRAKFGINISQVRTYCPQNGLSLNGANRMVENCLGVFYTISIKSR